MSKQLNVNLAFHADTSQAKAGLMDLQQSLNNLMSASIKQELPLTKSIFEAQNAVASLQVALKSAVNTDTGKLDLSKFNNSLQKSGLTLSDLRVQMEKLGPAGTNTFLQLSKSIMSAQSPLIRTNNLINSMWTSLKNTARWQISSSVLHGFMGALQSAYGYAQDLNESLNNIRIVTGQSIDEMARFAEQANKSAKALSTTTTEYTNASLIFYQQGLSADEVAKRTDVTIKMANAAGESAEKVSDQLTAVWNNFYDGTQSLEYYADVMTALGAATASSTDEIAGGLEKFAAIGETIGLSYEYAASALATITSNTRQSEEVVGTALKTIFARIQGLNLNETLDDGTTLNKYSEALEKVGVSIFDSSGELKAMDNILDEMAGRWDSLSKAQQVALAQTVAGVRQYTQLIALMENWDNGDNDSMMANVDTAKNSEGTLQKQADIYAESWEAARDRVKAASEDLFDSLINDEFFIDLTNGLEKVISLFGEFIDSIGGLPGILSVVAGLMTRIFSKQLTTSIDNMVYGFNSLAGVNMANDKQLKEQAYTEATNINTDSLTEAGAAENQGLQSQVEMQKMIEDAGDRISEQDKARLETMMQINDLYTQQAVAAAKLVDESKNAVAAENRNLRAKANRSEGKVSTQEYTKAKKEMDAMINSAVRAQKTLEKVNSKFQAKDIQGYNKQIDSVVSTLREIGQNSAADEIEKQTNKFQKGEISAKTYQSRIQGIIDSNEILDDAVIASSDAMASLGDGQVFTTKETDALANKQLTLAMNTYDANQAMNTQKKSAEDIKLAIQGAKGAADSFATSTVKTMQGVSSLAMGINSLVGAFDTLKNTDMSFGEKLLSVTMSLSMAIPALIGGLKILTIEQLKKNMADMKGLAIGTAKLAMTLLEKTGLIGLFGAKGADTAATLAGAKANITWQATAWPILVITLAIVAALGLIVGIAAGVIAAVNAISDAYNADAIAAENAKTAAENLKTAYGEAKAAYEDMISAMDDYTSARDALDDLVKGTEEYNAALEEANRAALELMQNYPEYFGEGSYEWKDGELILDEGAMEAAKKAEREKVSNAHAAATMADAGAKAAQAKANATDMKREQHKEVSLGNRGAYDDAVDKAMSLYAEDGNLFTNQAYLADKMAEVGVTNQELIQALWDNRDSLESLGAEFSQAELAMQVAAENVANNLVSNNEAVQASGEAEAVAAITAKSYQGHYEKEQEKALEDIKSRGAFNTGTDEAKALMAEYAAITGLDQDSNYKVKNYVGDGTVKVEKTLEDGSVEEVTLTAEEIAATVAAERANNLANQSMETVMADMVALSQNMVDTNGNGYADTADQSNLALKDFLVTGDLANTTAGQLEELQKEVIVKGDGTAFGDLEALQATAANLDATLSGSPEDYGYGSWLDMAEALTEAAENTEEAWNNIEIPEELKDAEGLTLANAQKIEDDVDHIRSGSQGEAGVETYTEGIEQLTAAMGEAEKSEFMNRIGDVDWSSWYAMEDVTAILRDMDVALNMTDEELQKFIEDMRIAGGASPVEMIQQTKANIEALGATLSKGVPPGSILDEETYNKMIETMPELEDQFMKTIDGSYKYVGEKELTTEDLNLGEMLDETRELSELYENSKEAAGNIDFKALSTGDYTFDDEMQVYEDAVDAAQDALDTAEANAEGLHPFAYKELEAAVDSAEGSLATAEKKVTSLTDANKKMEESLGSGLSSVLGNKDLMAVAEKQNWNAERLKQIQADLASSDQAVKEQAVKDAQEFNRQMEIFYTAGHEGEYDISEAEEQIASTATTIEELDELTNKYKLSTETYQKAITGLFATSAAEAESIGDLNTIMQKVVDAGGEVNMEVYHENVRRLAEEGMGAAESLSELEKVWRDASATGAELDYSLYADNLIRLGEAYSICSEEVKEFEIALQSGNEAVIKAAEEQLEATIMLGEAAEKYGFEQEELSIQSKQMAKAYGLEAKAAARLTIENQRMNKGVEDLVNNWDDWKKELQGSDKTSRDWAKAAAECTKTIANLVGASEDLELPAEFFDSAKNMELLAQAAQGSAKAIEELGLVVAAAQIEMLEFQEGMKNTAGNLIDQTQFDTWKNTILSGITEVQNGLDGLNIGDDVYEKLGGDDWVTALNEMAVATQMSVEEMQALLNSMNVDAEVTTTDVPQKVKVPVYTTTEDVTTSEKDGVTTYTKVSKTVQTGTEEMDGVVSVAQINTGDEIGDKPKITYIGNGNVSTSAKNGGKSGGGSKPKKAEKKKDTDTVERYKEIEDSLDDLRDSMEDVNKSTDRLYGASRIKQMDRVNNMIQEEIGLLKKKRQEAEEYLKMDKRALDAAASAAGVSLAYDGNGNVTNSTEALRRLNDQYNAAVDAANAEGGGPSESEQEHLDDLDKKISDLKDAMAQYEETRELIEDIDNEIDDKFYEWQDNNAEKLSYKLEIEIELNDDELRKLDYYLSKTEDDFYKRAEAATIMQDQLGVRTNSLASYGAHLAELEAAYAAGQISQQAYIEGLDEISDGIYGELEAINELDKQMMHYYGETLTAAREEIDKITDRLEQQTATLEHYMTVVDLMGKSTDYEKVGVILEGQVETTKNEMIAAREEFEMLDREKDEMYMKWKSATNEAQAELYKQQYEDALAASTEAQEEYLSKAEAYGEKLKAVLENSLNKYAQDLENALTGGTSFDQMTSAMERAQSLQEEYLTTTNKIYETNKLMNQAQQQIDKSSNTVAKQRLKQFINETNQLQEKNRLSQYELDIQKAKYELLLAEIALEETQNAKSQVRLQRDNEGNFGYVYTADEEKIAEAEQKLADAQNALYNIALEGANDYTQKYQQILNEMYDTLTDLQQQYLDGAFESEEEYQNAVLEAKQYYFEKLEQYSDLHSIALQTDSRVQQEAWSRDFNTMVNSTETWKTNVNAYVKDVEREFSIWEKQMSELASELGIGGDLENLENAVSDVTRESESLKDELVGPGGLLDALQQEIDAVTTLTDQYAAERQAVLDLAESYEALADSILAAKRAEAAKEEPTNVPPSATGGGGGSGGSKGDGTPTVGEVVTYTGGTYYHDSNGMTPSGNRGPGKKVTITRIVKGAKYPIHVQSSDSAYGWLKESQLSGFDTGGYTGEWGSYGKMALLHEKELVLNANETENFLASMELLNNIVSTIDLHAANSQFGGLLNSPALGGISSNETLEQQVTIEANFPNVSSRTEIEEAFSTLVNRASQYANRK